MIDIIGAVVWLLCAAITVATRRDPPWWIYAMTCVLLAAWHVESYFR